MEIIRQEVQYKCPDGFNMPSYLSRPKAEGVYPGIVFIYEVFGLNSEMKRLADEIASAGYSVLIPDLFERGAWIGCVVRLMKDLIAGVGQGVEDLLAARQWLATQTFADGQRMGLFGLCLGGGFALVLAKTGLFRAAAPFYGQAPKSIAGACPVVASFGGRDMIMTPGAAGLEAELTQLNIPHDVKVYPGVGHAFMNHAPNAMIGTLSRYAPVHGGFNQEAAADAMSRVLQFLSVHL